MSIFSRLFSSKSPEPTQQRVRVCQECGMPVQDHKEWCSIRRGQAELEQRKLQQQ